jgi:hypothetical protein
MTKQHKAPRRRQTEDQRRQTFQAVRIGDLNKVFGHRYGGGKLFVFPEGDDAAREDLRILLGHYARANPAAMGRIIRSRAPWLTDADRDDIFEEIARFPRMWKAQALGKQLNLSESDRTRLKIKTIGSVDVTAAQRKRLRKFKDRMRKHAQRRAAGAQTRHQWLADNSVSRDKPWDALGISRRTWYRRQKVGTGPSAIKLPDSHGTTCATEQATKPHGTTCATEQATRPSRNRRGDSSTRRVPSVTSAAASSQNQRRGDGSARLGTNLDSAPTVSQQQPPGVAESWQAEPMSMAA